MRLQAAVWGALFLGTLSLLGARCTPLAPPARLVGYFASWSIYESAFQVADVDAGRLTHLVYAFAALTSDGKCAHGDPWADVQKPYANDPPGVPYAGNFGQLVLLKQQHPSLRTLIAVGGWTGSTWFSDAASTAEGRTRLADSCVAYMRSHDFDGIDIDWEYPVAGGLPGNGARPSDRENLTLLLDEIRQRLDQAAAEDGRTYQLTLASPASPSLQTAFALADLAAHIDWFHVMTYDLAGDWSPTTGHHAPLFDEPGAAPGESAAGATQAYLDGGVARNQIVLGVPFYGRGWQGVGPEDEGLNQPHGGAAPGTFEPGVYPYGDLVERFLDWLPVYRSPGGAPWIYDPGPGLMISFDDATSVAAKAQYVRQQRLGGLMVWELSGDDAAGGLLATAAVGLGLP